MRCRINKRAIICMALTLRSIGIDYIYRLENEDRQLISIKALSSKFNVDLFYDVSVLAAMVAYRLRGTGESYWSDFAEMSKAKMDSPYDIVEDFLIAHKELAIKGKISRLEKLRKSDFTIMKNFDLYKNDPKKLYDTLSYAVKGSGKKTLSFAVKIFYYSVLARENKRIALPSNIPIPVDRRIIKVSKAIGMINADCAESKKISEAWGAVSRLSNIPPLNIDSYIWLKLYKVLYQNSND